MNKLCVFVIFLMILFSCTEDPDNGTPIEPEPESPVVLDLNQIPYNTLSTYRFFKNPLKDLTPEYGVLPYQPVNTLFTDYAHKKRFIWLPDETTVTYVSDHEPFEFPDGAAVIKNFYYDHVLPDDVTKIIETRIMVKKDGEWIFANYVWNDEQTEAYLDMDGSFVSMEWLQDGQTKSAFYRVPNESECFTCHKVEETPKLIGPKPSALNFDYAYADGTMNQIEKWREFGYYNTGANPQDIETLPHWEDTSLDKQTRMRAYMDINCAHCHRELAHCSYTEIRLDWLSTTSDEMLGICEPVSEPLDEFLFIIQPSNSERSAMFERFRSVDPGNMMPIIGRSIPHDEALELMESWINEMPDQNCLD